MTHSELAITTAIVDAAYVELWNREAMHEGPDQDDMRRALGAVAHSIAALYKA